MGRPRKWESDAERKRAERGVEPEVIPPEPAKVEDVVDEAPLPPLPEKRETISLEAFVAQELAITAAQIRLGLKDPDGKRMERSEAYARWRWHGYRDGTIARL